MLFHKGPISESQQSKQSTQVKACQRSRKQAVEIDEKFNEAKETKAKNIETLCKNALVNHDQISLPKNDTF